MIFALAACTQTVRFPESYYTDPTGETGQGPVQPPTPTPLIDVSTLTHGCNRAGTAFLAGFRTTGWTRSASMLLVGPTTHERHPLRLEDASIDGTWDRYALGPLLSDDDVLPGATTRFQCATDVPLAGWAAWTTDRGGSASDCVLFGTDEDRTREAIAAEAPSLAPLCVWLGVAP